MSLNFYPNGVVDFGTDVTGVVRALSILAILTLVVGMLVGSAMGLGFLDLSRAARATGKVAVEQSMELLLKSGFIRGITAEGTTAHCESTDT